MQCFCLCDLLKGTVSKVLLKWVKSSILGFAWICCGSQRPAILPSVEKINNDLDEFVLISNYYDIPV